MFKRFTGLWREPDFMNLWVGETVSMFGAQITSLALPLTATILLQASPGQMGILEAMSSLPHLLISLFAGTLIDNVRRRPLIITANLGSMIILSSIPLMAWSDFLTMQYLYLTNFLVTSMAVVFELAYLSYLPNLVSRERIVEGNSKLETSRAASQVAGPGIAGYLVQWFTAPFAILVDAFSYIISIIMILNINQMEQKPEHSPTTNQNIWQQIKEGLLFVFQHKLLRAIVSCTATLNFFASAYSAVFVLYVIREVGLNSSLLGIVLGVGSIGTFIGAALSKSMVSHFGLGTSLVSSVTLTGLGILLVSLSTKPLVVAVPLLILAVALMGFGGTSYFINQVSLRQAITPNRLLGRVNASMRFVSRSLMPIGALAGGSLGNYYGLQLSLTFIAIGAFLPAIVLVLSPVRKLRTTPDA